MPIINGRGRVGIRRAGTQIVSNGLILNLDASKASSYPGTGTTWTDLSASGYNGTLTNGPAYSSANSGSISFDGSNDYVSINPNLILSTSAGFSISAFIRLANYGGNYSTLFTLKTSFGSSIVMLFTTTSGYSPVCFGWNGSSVYRPSTSISANTWYGITLTYNGNGIGNASNFAFYRNDSLCSISGAAGFAGISQVNTLGTLNNGSGGFWFGGNIGNFSVYNRALSSAEVLQNFNVLKSRYGL